MTEWCFWCGEQTEPDAKCAKCGKHGWSCTAPEWKSCHGCGKYAPTWKVVNDGPNGNRPERWLCAACDQSELDALDSD